MNIKFIRLLAIIALLAMICLYAITMQDARASGSERSGADYDAIRRQMKDYDLHPDHYRINAQGKVEEIPIVRTR